jgi:hypothetical protein
VKQKLTELDWKYIVLIVVIVVNGILAFTNHEQLKTGVNTLTNDVQRVEAQQTSCESVMK